MSKVEGTLSPILQGRREASLVGGGGGGLQICLIKRLHFVNLTMWHIIRNFHFYSIIMGFPDSLVKSVCWDGQWTKLLPETAPWLPPEKEKVFEFCCFQFPGKCTLSSIFY